MAPESVFVHGHLWVYDFWTAKELYFEHPGVFQDERLLTELFQSFLGMDLESLVHLWMQLPRERYAREGSLKGHIAVALVALFAPQRPPHPCPFESAVVMMEVWVQALDSSLTPGLPRATSPLNFGTVTGIIPELLVNCTMIFLCPRDQELQIVDLPSYGFAWGFALNA